MRVKRENLTVLLNRLYDRGEERFTISHPASEIGDLLEITLKDQGECTVRFITDSEEYATVLGDVQRTYPETVAKDLPDSRQFRNAVVASGVLELENADEIQTFLNRYGDPDLMAGHAPVLAGIDTNLLPWRIDRILGLHDPDAGLGYVNGFVLATGIREELDWDYKCHDTSPFEDAFGEAFDEYWNQPLGSARLGRLGLLTYRRIRDIEQAIEIQSERGDGDIIDAYDAYDREYRNEILLFSNDRNFVEQARAHRMLGQRVDFPSEFPRLTTATWTEIEDLLFMFATLFGIIKVPSTTLFGVWRGKDELDWQYERVKVTTKSPPLESNLKADLSIVESYEEMTTN